MRADLNSVISDDSTYIELINGSFGSLVSVFLNTFTVSYVIRSMDCFYLVFVYEKE